MKCPPPPPKVVCNNSTLKLVAKLTYLGGQELVRTRQDHVNKLIKQANRKLYLTKQIWKNLSKETTALLYKQMVLPLIRIWILFSAKRETVNKLDKIQERALKMIAYQYGDPLRPTIRTLMQTYHIEDLSKR